MTRIVILYPNVNQNWFDKEYYLNNHVPLVKKCLEPYGMQKFELDIGIAGMNGPAPYFAIGYLSFESLNKFQQGMSAEGDKLMGDIPNYTRDVIVQIGETADIGNILAESAGPARVVFE